MSWGGGKTLLVHLLSCFQGRPRITEKGKGLGTGRGDGQYSTESSNEVSLHVWGL